MTTHSDIPLPSIFTPSKNNNNRNDMSFHHPPTHRAKSTKKIQLTDLRNRSPSQTVPNRPVLCSSTEDIYPPRQKKKTKIKKVNDKKRGSGVSQKKKKHKNLTPAQASRLGGCWHRSFSLPVFSDSGPLSCPFFFVELNGPRSLVSQPAASLS